jgi:hypothetical protein
MGSHLLLLGLPRQIACCLRLFDALQKARPN